MVGDSVSRRSFLQKIVFDTSDRTLSGSITGSTWQTCKGTQSE